MTDTDTNESRDLSLLSHRRGRLAVTGMLAAVALLFSAHSVKIDLFYWPYQGFLRSEGTLLSVLENVNQLRLMTFYAGMASRDAAGGAVERLIGPTDLNSLADVPRPEGAINPYSGYFLQQMSGMRFEQVEYDPVLPDAFIERLLDENETVAYPMNVVGVAGADPGGSVMLFTDTDHEVLYALPLSLVPEELRR